MAITTRLLLLGVALLAAIAHADDTDGCVDNDPSCPSWATETECSASPEVMRRECARTCDLCEAPDDVAARCIDRRPECEDWMQIGLCTRSPAAMLEACPRSCNKCAEASRGVSLPMRPIAAASGGSDWK